MNRTAGTILREVVMRVGTAIAFCVMLANANGTAGAAAAGSVFGSSVPVLGDA